MWLYEKNDGDVRSRDTSAAAVSRSTHTKYDNALMSSHRLRDNSRGRSSGPKTALPLVCQVHASVSSAHLRWHWHTRCYPQPGCCASYSQPLMTSLTPLCLRCNACHWELRGQPAAAIMWCALKPHTSSRTRAIPATCTTCGSQGPGSRHLHVNLGLQRRLSARCR